MLAIKMVSDDVIEVKETLFSYSANRVTHWYYNIKEWKKSSRGKEGETPDRIMNEQDINWVKKHYLPKVGK